MLLFVVLAVAFGLAVGSFLNVVVWRVPRGESVVRPPSACPRCGHAIRWRDNIPVVSWLVLRGNCRDCSAPISGRYPAVELITGLAFGATLLCAGISWALPALLYFVAVGIALTAIDLDTRRLPDALVLPSYPIGLALLALASANPGGPSDWHALFRAVLAAVAFFLVYFVIVLVYPKGMGFGDAKLAGVLGLYLGWWGWSEVVVGWFAAFVLGGVFSVGLMIAGRAGRKSTIPFGPWMIAGAFVGLLVGGQVADWYLGFLR